MPDNETILKVFSKLEQAKINRLNALRNMYAIEEYLDGLSYHDKRELTIWAHMELYYGGFEKYHEENETISEFLVWGAVKEWCVLNCWNVFCD
jgi:hypothetical protein